jgi:uncharacterized protein (DUF58 family)
MSASIAFALAGILTLNLSWVFLAVAIAAMFVYARGRFVQEIEGTDLDIRRTVLDDLTFTDEPSGVSVEVLNKDPVTIRGVFEDILPKDCEILAGSNRTDTVLPSKSLLDLSYSVVPKVRGDHLIPGMRIERIDVFGLQEEVQVIEKGTMISAHTRRETLDTARKMVGKEHLEFSGMARNPSIVLRELEFDGIRDYVPGDRARDIHWKLLPKLGKLMTKTYKKEGSLQTMVFVDCGRSMRVETDAIAKVDHALDLSMQLSNVLLSSYHPSGVATFDEMKVLDKVPPALGRHQFEKIVQILRNVPKAVKVTEGPEAPEEEGPKGAPAESAPLGAQAQRTEFMSTLERMARGGSKLSLGMGLEGAVKESLAKSKGQELLFIVISDLISSRDAVLTSAKICQSAGSRMLVIHTYDGWYRKSGDVLDMKLMESLYSDLGDSLKIEGALRGLGSMYIRIGPADTTAGIVRAIRRGKA